MHGRALIGPNFRHADPGVLSEAGGDHDSRRDLGETSKNPFKGTSDERDAVIKKVNEEFKKLNELRDKAAEKKDAKDCGHGMAPRQSTGGAYVCFGGSNMAVGVIGTGETIGHVADVRIHPRASMCRLRLRNESFQKAS